MGGLGGWGRLRKLDGVVGGLGARSGQIKRGIFGVSWVGDVGMGVGELEGLVYIFSAGFGSWGELFMIKSEEIWR